MIWGSDLTFDLLACICIIILPILFPGSKSERTMVFASEVTKIHTLIFQGLLFSSGTQMSDCQLFYVSKVLLAIQV